MTPQRLTFLGSGSVGLSAAVIRRASQAPS